MNSLKQFIPLMSGAFVNLSESALYERQRALVRAGLLHPVAGRGPGSGVELSPESVAMLLLAVLGTDNLSEVEAATKSLVTNIRITTPETKGILIGAKNMHEALALSLREDVEEKNEILVVNVNRRDLTASIYCAGAMKHPIMFLNKRKFAGRLKIQSGFHGGVLS